MLKDFFKTPLIWHKVNFKVCVYFDHEDVNGTILPWTRVEFLMHGWPLLHWSERYSKKLTKIAAWSFKWHIAVLTSSMWRRMKWMKIFHIKKTFNEDTPASWLGALCHWWSPVWYLYSSDKPAGSFYPRSKVYNLSVEHLRHPRANVLQTDLRDVSHFASTKRLFNVGVCHLARQSSQLLSPSRLRYFW